MKVGELMSKDIEIINPDFTLQQAAEKMRTLDVGYLPIGENDRLVGTITDRDITIRATAKGMDPKETKIRDIMTSKVIFCFEDQPVEEAVKKMEDNQIRRLTVLDKNKRAVGVFSLGDLSVSKDEELISEVIENVAEHHE